MGILCYLYNKYLEWANYYRKRPQLEPLPYPAVVASEPLSENTIDLRRKSYKEALLKNLKKV